MFGNLVRVNVPSEHLRGAVMKTVAKDGQWGFIDGADAATGDPAISVVSESAHTEKARRLLGAIQYDPLSNEQVSSVIDDENIAIGTRILFLNSEGDSLEQLNLTGKVAGVFSSAAPGAAMVLTVSGWPTLDGATDDPGGSSTVVAYFENVKATSVTYRTI